MGDFYDVVPAAGRFGVVIGDVCGKGAAAARTTAMARSAIRTTAHTEADPTRVLAAVNDVLRVWFDGRPEFVSALYAVFGPAPGTPDEPWRVRVAGAGHPPAFLRRSGGSVEQLAGGGVVLGIEPESPIAVEDLELWPWDALLLCTDGITEAHAPGSDRQFDDSGVRDVLAAVPAPLDADAMAGAVCDAAVAHCGGLHHDDIGVVTVRLAAGSSTPGGPRGGTG